MYLEAEDQKRQFNREFVASILIILAGLCMAAIFIARHAGQPSFALGADAWGYQFYALRFREYGVFHDFGSVRTYGYPLFLYLLSFFTGSNQQLLSVVSGMTQYALFFGASLWLAVLASRISKALSLSVLSGLLFNPLLVAMVTDTLTESLSVPLFLGLTATSFLALRGGRSSVGWLAIGAFVAAYAVMVRPSNLVFVIAWHLAVVLASLIDRYRGGIRSIVVTGALGTVAAVTVWGPQAIYNLHSFGSLRFLPYCNLGDFQVSYSVIAWKYDTVSQDGVAGAWNYLNPLFTGVMPSNGGWGWYVENPISGIITILAHIFNSFSVTSLFTYVTDFHPIYGMPLRTLYWFVFGAGLVGIFSGLYSIIISGGRIKIASWTILPVAFLIFSFCGTVAMNSISAVELRFNIIPIGILFVSAAYALAMTVRNPKDFVSFRAFLVVIITVFGVAGSYAMDRLGYPGLDGRSIDVDASNCVLVHTSDDATAIKEFHNLLGN